MNIRNTYWIVSLSVVLSLSMVLPYCCHADISELFSHHQEMPAHAMHGQHSDSGTDGAQCDCGHEFVKDFQKTKKVVSSLTLPPSLAGLPLEGISFPVNSHFLSIRVIQPGILSDSGPPIHLLNGVFLN